MWLDNWQTQIHKHLKAVISHQESRSASTVRRAIFPGGGDSGAPILDFDGNVGQMTWVKIV